MLDLIAFKGSVSANKTNRLVQGRFRVKSSPKFPILKLLACFYPFSRMLNRYRKRKGGGNPKGFCTAAPDTLGSRLHSLSVRLKSGI